MPRKIKKKRMLTADDGSELGWEEYYDYQFPDEQKAPANLKILEMAHKWKMAQKRKAGGNLGGQPTHGNPRVMIGKFSAHEPPWPIAPLSIAQYHSKAGLRLEWDLP